MLAKAKDRPDLVKQVIDKMKKEGVRNTLEKVFTKLDTPIPLGYGLAGLSFAFASIDFFAKSTSIFSDQHLQD
jgi:pantoate kinase